MNGLVSTTVADLDYALHEGLDQETFDRRFSGANFIGDYYGRMGDRVLRNSDLTEEEAASSLFFAVAQADGTLYFSGDYMFMPLQYSYVDPSSGSIQGRGCAGKQRDLCAHHRRTGRGICGAMVGAARRVDGDTARPGRFVPAGGDRVYLSAVCYRTHRGRTRSCPSGHH